jgi:hypothetical protein
MKDNGNAKKNLRRHQEKVLTFKTLLLAAPRTLRHSLPFTLALGVLAIRFQCNTFILLTSQ